MCTELLLAIIYFLTIGIINFFLYKLLKNYYQTILKEKKIKNIFSKCNCENNAVFPYLYNYIDQNNKNDKILDKLNKCSNIEDFLIIGNTYKNLRQYSVANKSFDSLYLKLLENQILKRE